MWFGVWKRRGCTGGLWSVHSAKGSNLKSTNFASLLTEKFLMFHVCLSRTRRRKRPEPGGLETIRDLKEGDAVIHMDHGIGRYMGLTRLMLSGLDGDYVHLEYADGDKLYVPIYRLNLLQQYRGPQGNVRLDKSGGTRWAKDP